MIPRMKKGILFAALLTLLPLSAAARQRPADFVWLEGENPTSANVKNGGDMKVEANAWGHTEFFSSGKWLQISVDADKVEKAAPIEGVLLTYTFDTPKQGSYEIWDRIGYEFARSPFQWRMDSGAYRTVSPEDLTSDLMEFATWNELAWLQLGKQTLSAGKHTLTIRLPKTKNKDGKFERILYASDAFCISLGAFHPNSKYKPGESRNDPSDALAAKNVFALPEPAASANRADVPLNGLWEICRDDEQLPKTVAEPIKSLPENPVWTAIAVPGDKNALRPDLLFAHRVWYRTHIAVPGSQAGRSFQITFPQNNLITTVYVNGVLCGWNKNPFAKFTIDVTKGIKPGETNVIMVGIKDAYYGYSASPTNPLKLRKTFNLPLDFTKHGFQDFAYPVWNGMQSGILNTPTFTVSGGFYVADVFCKPSVATKALALEITLANGTGKAQSGEIVCEAVNPKTGATEKTFAPQSFTLDANGGEKVLNVSEAWANPRLWWPDDPQMTLLRTTVKLGGKAIDVSETPFGFREWGSVGKNYTLNGIVFHGWADLQPGGSPQEFVANYRKTRQKTMRYMGISQGGVNWNGLEPTQALDFFDSNGVVVRRCGPVDGEAIGYNAIENDPELQKLYNSNIKMDLLNNVRDQMVAQVRGERNHPSVMLWSLENEYLFINCINLYGDRMDNFEKAILDISNAVRAADPTRLTMTDGGGANKDNAMPVHGNHYVYTNSPADYPQKAYEAFPEGGGRGRWVWDEKRPRFIGEDYYASGINPADYAWVGGEATFQGKAQAADTMGLVFKMLTEGYRWAEQSAWHHWVGPDSMSGAVYNSQSWLAVFCRQWDWTFGSGQKIKRTFGIFNDTHSSDPVTFAYTLNINGKPAAHFSAEYTVPAGTNKKFDLPIQLPTVTARTEGELILTLTQNGKPAFRDVKAVSILPPVKFSAVSAADKSGVSLAAFDKSSKAAGALSAKNFCVYDPNGGVSAYLKAQAVPFTPIGSLAALPATGKVLLIGKDALTAQESGSSLLAAWAADGKTVIVLEQKNPLKYQALPAQIETTGAAGRIAFGEDLSHPALRGLKQKDFFTWGSGEIIYRQAYQKPTAGAKSLVQCDSRLQDTALVEVPAGQGLILLSQLTIAENLETSAVAQKLLANLIDYGANYKLTFRSVVAVSENPLLTRAMDATGLQYSKSSDPLVAIAAPGKIAIVSATPANLKTLADNLPKIETFTKSGGWLLFHDLTPDGLSDYNKIVGFDHMIRPFKRERVSFPVPKSPLTSGVSVGDIVLLSGQKINGFNDDEYTASDEFSYVVDYEDVAPFAKSAFFAFDNITNNFVGADGWQLIINFPIPTDGKPSEVPLTFPKPQTISEFTWIGDTNYWPQTKVNLVFDGRDKVEYDVKPDNSPQVLPVNPPRTGTNITLQIADWQKIEGRGALIGIDNIYLKAQRPPEFYQKVKPLLNIGAMLEYPRGSGGMVLCNLLFKDSETVPINAEKKKTIFATVLRNLKAPFAGGKSVIAGAGLAYTPIDLSKAANQYRDERGWFGDKETTFAALPTGKQKFAGVVYDIYDFKTSPVPTAVMLGANGVPNNLPDHISGIAVNRKADALFFLQAARMDSPRSEQERRENRKFELARYVIHYADGQTVSVPIYAEIDIDSYRQAAPQSLRGAQIAWTKPYGNGQTAVAYAKQWNNPRPGVEISSLDFQYGADRRGVPALLAVTAATAN